MEHLDIPGLSECKPFARGGLAMVWQARQLSLDRARGDQPRRRGIRPPRIETVTRFRASSARGSRRQPSRSSPECESSPSLSQGPVLSRTFRLQCTKAVLGRLPDMPHRNCGAPGKITAQGLPDLADPASATSTAADCVSPSPAPTSNRLHRPRTATTLLNRGGLPGNILSDAEVIYPPTARRSAAGDQNRSEGPPIPRNPGAGVVILPRW